MASIANYDDYLQVKKGLEDLESMQATAERDAGNRFGLKAMFEKERHNHISLISHLYGIYVQNDDEVIPTYRKLVADYERDHDVEAANQAAKQAEEVRSQQATASQQRENKLRIIFWATFVIVDLVTSIEFLNDGSFDWSFLILIVPSMAIPAGILAKIVKSIAGIFIKR